MLRTTSCSFPSFKSPSRQWKQQRVELKTDWKCSECSMNLKKTSLNLELFLCLSSDRQKPGGLPEGPQLTNNKQTQRTEEETFSKHLPTLPLSAALLPSWRWGIWQTNVTCVTITDPRESVRTPTSLILTHWGHVVLFVSPSEFSRMSR